MAMSQAVFRFIDGHSERSMKGKVSKTSSDMPNTTGHSGFEAACEAVCSAAWIVASGREICMTGKLKRDARGWMCPDGLLGDLDRLVLHVLTQVLLLEAHLAAFALFFKPQPEVRGLHPL